MKKQALTIMTLASVIAVAACNEKETASAPETPAGIAPELFTDSLFAVMNADRANYTKLIVQRLGPKGANVIKPDEHWKDLENGALLPAQMFRAGSEAVAEKTDKFTYSLQSLWPIGKQNGPKTEIEKVGLQYIVDNPGKNYYGTEELGGVNYYTAVYPDVAVAEACVSCHNEHVDTPKTDFKIGDVMGGVVIRVPLQAQVLVC